MDFNHEPDFRKSGLIFGKKGTLIGFIVMLIIGLLLYFSGSL